MLWTFGIQANRELIVTDGQKMYISKLNGKQKTVDGLLRSYYIFLVNH